MRLKKLKVFALTSALCAGIFAAGCGTIKESQEEPAETEEAAAEEEAEQEEEPEQEGEPEQEEEPEVVLQKIGDPSASIEVLITNDMGSAVSGLAVKDPGEAEYPDNMMAEDQIIADGETVEFFYEPAESEDSEEADGSYFLQVTLEDGTIYEISYFDLEDLSEVELCLQDEVAYLKYVSLAKKITINTIEIELAHIEDMEAAQALNDRIAAFGEVTSENKEEVKSIREAYDAMTEDQKAVVTNAALLEEMEAAVASIEEEEAAAQAAAEQAAAEQAAAEQAAAEQAAAEQAAAEQAAAEQAAAEQEAAEQAAAEEAASSDSSSDYANGWTADSAYELGYSYGQQWAYKDAEVYSNYYGITYQNPYYDDFWNGYYDAVAVTPQPDDWEDWHDEVNWYLDW